MNAPAVIARPSGRGPTDLRMVSFETAFTRHADVVFDRLRSLVAAREAEAVHV